MNEQYNISFSKNIGHSQMCIEPISMQNTESSYVYTKDYRTKMICNNTINGLLRTHVQLINGIPNFNYDISSLQSLAITLENKPLNYILLSHIIYEIYTLLFTCDKYMLDTDKLLLDPEYIFLDTNSSTVKLCYLPLKTTDFITSMRKLFDYFLKHIDHSDEKCVYTAYSIHNHCISNSLTPNILISYINTEETSMTTNSSIHDNHNFIPESQDTNSLQKNTLISSNENKFMINSSEHLPSDKKSNTFNASNTAIKFSLLAICFFICLICIFALYIFNVIDILLLICMFLVLAGASCLIGYNIYTNIEGPLQSTNSIDTELLVHKSHSYVEDSGDTILLSSSESSNSHMLIYTGSDMNSQANITHYPFTIGKDSSCDLVLHNPIISRLHCRINFQLDDNNLPTYYLEDLNSTNGTYINNTPVTPYKKCNLKSGDNISFGHLTYIFM